MLDWAANYTYLAASAVLLAAFAASLPAIGPRHRRAALWSAALSVPTALSELFFIPDYWTPKRLADAVVGLEDMMFCFAIGGLTWCCVACVWRERYEVRIHPAHTVRRFALCFVIALALGLALKPTGLKPMTQTVVVVIVLACALLIHQPGLWRLAASGVLILTPAYFAYLVGLFAAFPGYLDQWNATNLWGPSLLGVPLDELAWAAMTGLAWPVIAGWSMETRWVGASGQSEKFKETAA